MTLKSKNTGFSLIEILVVVAIISLLMTVALVSLSDTRKKARDNAREADIEQIKAAVKSYAVSTGSYPDSLDDLLTVGVFNDVPVDPLNEDDYVYTYTNNSSCYDLTYKKEMTESSVDEGNCDS